MKLGDRLNTALTRALMHADAGAIDPTRDSISHGSGGHGKHGTTTAAPSGAFAPLEDRPPVVVWAERFSRMLDVLERELDEAESGAVARSAKGDRTGPQKRAEDRAIVSDYVGVDPTRVAYIFGRTTEGIRKLRQRSQRDPDTGERVRSDVLTAHPRHFQHESTTPQEDQ